MKIHCKKILSLLLAISLLLTLSPVTPVAAEETATATNEPTLSATEEITETDALAAVPAIDLTADCAILNYVDEEVFAAGNHVLRLAEEETLSSYVFLNADGTKTVYYLDEAVKFVDGDGNIQEKDVTLALSGTAYTTTRNDISLSIPTNPTNGITLIWNGHAVRILPQGGTLSDTVLDGNSIRYTDYYGAGADLVYTPTLSGVKEDIVLESYTGQNVFTFMLNTGGLNLFSANGRYYLAESKTATARIELGNLVTFDANGRFSVGTMTSQTVSAGNIYCLTLTVDEAFLTDPNTVYPVEIDPELKVSDNTHGAGAIEDVNIYSGTPNATANWKYMHVGYYDDTYKKGRILVRLTGLLNDTEYQNMSASQITSATFYLTEATGKAAANINLYAFQGSSTWTESGATWNNVGADNFGDLIDTVNHGRSSEAEYDITALVKGWKTGASSASAGFILCHSSEDTKTKGFYSSEYASNTDYRPYVKVVYDSTSGMIEADQNYVPEGEQITLSATGMNGQITWTSSNPARATVSSTGVVTGILAGQVTITASCEGYTDKNCVIWVTVPDGYYYLKNAASDLILECSTTSASSANCYIYSLDETSTNHAAEVWKIKYVIGGRYIIRPLSRMVSCLTRNSAKNALVIDYNIADTFSAVPSSASWTIGHNSFGYYFYSNGNDQAALRPAVSNTAGTTVVVGAWTSAKDSHWNLTGAAGVFLRDTSTLRTTNGSTVEYMELGQTAAYSALGLSMMALRHTSGYTWSSSNPQVATVDSGGRITAVGRGETDISVQVSSLGVVYTAVFRVVVRETIYVLNLYDSTFATNSSYIGYIDEAVEFLNTVYSDEFYLYFDSKNPVLYDDPVLLVCDNGITEACTSDNCGISCINHHKNIMRICNDLYGKWSKNHIVVMWRNASPTYFCGFKTTNGVSQHSFIPDGTLAITPYRDLIARDDFLPVIQVLDIDGWRGNCSVQSFMSLILAHEVAHTIGIHDVYEYDYHEDDLIYDHYAAALDEEYGCLMCSYVGSAAEGFYSSILGFDTAFCAHCKSNITAEMKSDMYES